MRKILQRDLYGCVKGRKPELGESSLRSKERRTNGYELSGNPSGLEDKD